MTKSHDTEAWFLEMKKFFRLHDYLESMKSTVTTFSLKGKTDIWCEDVNTVRGIQEEDFTWNEFEWLFKRKFLS